MREGVSGLRDGSVGRSDRHQFAPKPLFADRASGLQYIDLCKRLLSIVKQTAIANVQRAFRFGPESPYGCGHQMGARYIVDVDDQLIIISLQRRGFVGEYLYAIGAEIHQQAGNRFGVRALKNPHGYDLIRDGYLEKLNSLNQAPLHDMHPQAMQKAEL